MNKKTLSTIAVAEAISYITFAITMPLKYGLEIYWPNKIVGWMHGLLFILYLLAVAWGSREYNWGLKNTFLALLASLVPFMPFWIEKKLIRPSVKSR